MKVALIAPEIPDYAMEFARTISGRVQTLLLIPRKYRPDQDWVQSSGVHVEWVDWPRQRELCRSIAFMRHLSARVKSWRPDVVHLTMNGHVWTTALLRLLRPLPVLTTVHDVDRHPGDDDTGQVPRVFFDLGVRQSDAIVVHGESLRQNAMARWSLVPEKCFVLPHVPLGRYKEIATAAGFRRPGDGVFRILFFGRICEYKGLNYLLHAAQVLEESGKRVKLVVAGRGNLDPYRAAMAPLSSIEVHNGFVSEHEAARLFAESDVLVLPYIEASQSGVLMIAMTFGLPVVASAVGEISESVAATKMGILVPPGDSIALACALHGLIYDVEMRRELASNGLHALGVQYSRKTLAERAEWIYERVLAFDHRKLYGPLGRIATDTSIRH